MAITALVYGNTGVGKSTSLRTLNPKTTFIIDADRKGLGWKGWRKQYNKENDNFAQISDVKDVNQAFKVINELPRFAHIKTLVLDGLSTVMIDDEVRRSKEKGFDKWTELASSVWGLVSEIGTDKFRTDLNIILIGHLQVDDDGFCHIKTSGRRLEKYVLESKFNTVLFAKIVDGEHVFETKPNNSSARSLMGCFESDTIPNDMQYVIDTLRKYEEDDDDDTQEASTAILDIQDNRED